MERIQTHLGYVEGEGGVLDWGKSGTRGGQEIRVGSSKGEKGRSRKASGWEENPSRKKQHFFLFVWFFLSFFCLFV